MTIDLGSVKAVNIRHTICVLTLDEVYARTGTDHFKETIMNTKSATKLVKSTNGGKQSDLVELDNALKQINGRYGKDWEAFFRDAQRVDRTTKARKRNRPEEACV
jgi:hypothetical protein